VAIGTSEGCGAETWLQGTAIRTADAFILPTSQEQMTNSTNLMMFSNRRLALPRHCPSQVNNLLCLELGIEVTTGLLQMLATARNSRDTSPAPFIERLLSESGYILSSSNMAALTNETAAFTFLGSCV
jgi:hypothetical protein